MTRTGCNGGVTGEANLPDVEVTDEEPIITFTVSPGEPPLGADCPGNDEVSYQVELPQAIGNRSLLDGYPAA